MQKEVKYYTPELEEFHIGFKYEYNCNSDIYGRKWIVNNLSLEDIQQDCDGGYEYSNPYNASNYGVSIRVKYLDENDIKDLGWEFDERVRNAHYFNLSTYCMEVIYYSDRILVDISEDGDCDISAKLYVKNKSELKKILKMIGV
jgi:hypothetical protein